VREVPFAGAVRIWVGEGGSTVMMMGQTTVIMAKCRSGKRHVVLPGSGLISRSTAGLKRNAVPCSRSLRLGRMNDRNTRRRSVEGGRGGQELLDVGPFRISSQPRH
jgi:hypothetical protein